MTFAIALGYVGIGLIVVGLVGFTWCVMRAPLREDLARVDEQLDREADWYAESIMDWRDSPWRDASEDAHQRRLYS